MSFLDSLASGIGDIASSIGDSVGNLGSDISSWFGGGSGTTDALGTFSSGGVNLTPGALSTIDTSATDWGGALGGVSSTPWSDALGLGTSVGGDLGTFNTNNLNLTGGATPTTLTAPGNFNSSTPINVTGTSTGGLGTLGSLAGGITKALVGGGSTSGSPSTTTTTTTTPTSTGGAGGAGTGGSSGGSGILGSLGSLISNPAVLTGLISPIMSAITASDQQDLGPDAASLRTLATNNQALSAQLSQEAAANQVGNLPGAALASLEANLSQQKAGLQQRYAAMGMSGSSAEAADLASLNQQSEGQRFTIGQNMANEALSQVTSLNSQDQSIYSELMNAQTQRDEEYMNAMSGLAQAFGKAFSGSGSTSTSAAGGTAGGAATTTLQSLLSSSGSGGSSLSSLLQSIGGGLVGQQGGISTAGDSSTLTSPTAIDYLPTQLQTTPDLSGLTTVGDLTPTDFTAA